MTEDGVARDLHSSHEVAIPVSDGTGHIIEDVTPALDVTPAQRLAAVGYVSFCTSSIIICRTHHYLSHRCSVALIGVLGATGACTCSPFDARISPFIASHYFADTTIRAIGKRAHPLHNLVSFSSQCVIVSTVA